MRERMETLVRSTQEQICAALERLEGAPLRTDTWQRPAGGGGTSRVLQAGRVFEKAGVNVSVVHGTLSPEAAASMAGGQIAAIAREHPTFFATGVSVVIHPSNPMAPTAHCNYRYFELGRAEAPAAWWFGGGADLTPAYLFEEDARHFHAAHKAACDAHDPTYYPRFKKWCDDYFYIPHRSERRGLGGIFFDNLQGGAPEPHFDFVAACAGAFVDAYFPIVERRMAMPFTDHNKQWQALRRGRYVEFNLLYDRGTTFGLKTDGRVESILMSLPLEARWEYCHTPAPDSREAEVLAVLREPRDWLNG